ncbi:LPXTG cell wall anchor domain-containing protein [Micromonospora profundi]|uniref:LPXTG cell wall anchor domain-containing protein n=1 Tax=Micromonospora TaxID=1873 RepID=UPI0033B96BE7
MRRPLVLGVLAAALYLPVLAAPAVAGPAPVPTSTAEPAVTAAAPQATILARGDLVFLSGDPWRPSSPLEVDVKNVGRTAAKGFFVLRLPPNVRLTTVGDCRTVDGADRTWLCGGVELAPEGSRKYRLTVTSSAAKPVFGVKAWGSVAGRDAAGVTDQFSDFRINWPDKTSLRLRATASPVVNGSTTVRVRVTNTGAFAIGGYSLNITTPAGVRVTAPACSDSGRMDGVGCEILRLRTIADGATDSFDVRLAVTGGTRTVTLSLAPSNRYTNKDTSVTLRLNGAGGSGAGATTPPPASPTATPTTPSTSPTNAPELARTGASSSTFGLVGAALLALGVGLVALQRRLFRG